MTIKNMNRITLPDRMTRIKLALLVATVILVAHSFSAGWTRENFPVVRWHMFAGVGKLPLPDAQFIHYQVTDSAGTSHRIEGADLYADSGIGGAEQVNARLAQAAVSDRATRRVLVERMRQMLNVEIERVEIWKIVYAVNIELLPHIDTANPKERILLADFRVEDIA